MPRKTNKINENKKQSIHNQMIGKNEKIKITENRNKINKENYIIAEININKDNINKDIRIINSFEESKQQIERKIDINIFGNEKEIKEKFIIEINNQKIPFKYIFINLIKWENIR